MKREKNKGDSNLNGLLRKQRAQVDRWLFERTTYKECREVPERFWTADEHDQCVPIYHAKKQSETDQLGRDAQKSRLATIRRTYESVLQGVETMAWRWPGVRGQVKARDLSDLVHLLIAGERSEPSKPGGAGAEQLEYDVATACPDAQD